MPEEERVQAVRKGEDLVEVGDGEQVTSLGLYPKRLVQALALGAVPVAAGVVDRILAPAVIAALQVSSQGCGATRRQRRDDPGLLVAEVRQFARVLFEDLAQFRTLCARAPRLAVRHELRGCRCLLSQSIEGASCLMKVVLRQVRELLLAHLGRVSDFVEKM